jgi:streptogramin lyase
MTALPPHAQRHLMRMRSLEPPIDLVDSIMAEVEATPQVRSGPALRTVFEVVLAAAVVLLAVAVPLRFGARDVGPAPTPPALDQLPSAGSVVARIPVEPADEPAAFGHGFLWLTNAVAGELIRMDPANGSIVTPLRVTRPRSAVPIALTESSVWVADARDGSLVELDPASRDEIQRTPVEGTVDALATDGADLWLLHAETGEIARLDASNGSTTWSVPIEGASSLLVHADAVWVGDALGNVVRIDPGSGDETGRVVVGTPVRRLVANGDGILVLGAPGEPLARVDGRSAEVVARGVPVVDAATIDGPIWALLGSGHLVRLDPATLHSTAAHVLEVTGANTLAAGGDWLWTTGLDEAANAQLLRLAPAR